MWMAAIPSGQTLRRVRFSWGFAGITAIETDLPNQIYDVVTLGLVTTIGNGSETPPNALTASGDAAPPTRRWLWWETRQPVISAIDYAAGVIAWRDSGPQESVDVRSQVLATGIPAGETLNLWGSFATSYDWDSSGAVTIWLSTSVLYG